MFLLLFQKIEEAFQKKDMIFTEIFFGSKSIRLANVSGNGGGKELRAVISEERLACSTKTITGTTMSTAIEWKPSGSEDSGANINPKRNRRGDRRIASGLD